MNEMVFAKLLAEEIVNELIARGVFSVRGSYDPDKRVQASRDAKAVGYADVISALNKEVSESRMYNSTRTSMLTIIPADGNEKYYKAIIEIIKDGNTLPSSKLELVRRVTNKFYSK